MKAYKINSQYTRRLLQKQAVAMEGKALNDSQQNMIIATLESLAGDAGDARDVFLRYGHHGQNILVDLARHSEEVVEITPEGWRVLASHLIPLQRVDGMGVLPIPVPGGSLNEFRDLMQLPEDVWHRILAFILGSINPRGPYMILMLEGDHGSGKTLLSSFIRKLIDPHGASSVSLPRDERDLVIYANSNWLLSFDNLSGIGRDISDALCRLATEGGFSTRRLYTNDELTVFKCMRPMLMNGITAYANQPDLRDRAIFVTLPALPPENRRTEQELRDAFEDMLPRLLGALYDAASAALRTLPTTVPPKDIRMMDFARWVQAAESHLGMPEGTMVAAIRYSQEEKEQELADTDEVYRAVLLWMANAHGQGPSHQERGATMGELFNGIREHISPLTLRYTGNPKMLSDYLKRHRKQWARRGLHIEEGPRTKRGKVVVVRLEEPLTQEQIEGLKVEDRLGPQV